MALIPQEYLQKFRVEWSDPQWWRDSVLPFLTRQAMIRYFNLREPDGVNVMREDWDNLIILDACRYDVFEEHNTLPGTIERRTSHGSSTPEFLHGNFSDGPYHDTVYVTANPQVNIRLDNPFHALVNAWEFAWDESVHTVRPEAMKEATLQAHRDFPNKRLIAHFVQPHYPFIGETAEQIGDHAGGELSYRQATDQEEYRDAPIVWELLESGEVSRQSVWDAYIENLTLTLPHVQALVKDLEGKTVVTSDHGNLFGEFVWPFPVREYGHPREIYVHELITVPWLTIEKTPRKPIETDPSIDIEPAGDSETVADRLEALGYTT